MNNDVRNIVDNEDVSRRRNVVGSAIQRLEDSIRSITSCYKSRALSLVARANVNLDKHEVFLIFFC